MTPSSPFLRRGALLAAVLAVSLLAACGDDPAAADAAPVADGSVPASATASARAYSQFAGSLAASESAAPLTIGDFEAPKSETDEPEPVT